MEAPNTQDPNNQPDKWKFAVPEVTPNSSKPFIDKSLEKLPEVENREQMRASNRSEILSKANEKLVNNENLYKKFIHAISMKEDGSVEEISAIENLFIRYCLNLSPQEIKSLVESFLTNCKRWFSTHKDEISPSKFLEEKMGSGIGILYPEGIISVVEYIRSRKQLLDSDPSQSHKFCVNNSLDAKWAIDVIEIIYDSKGETPSIHQISLVQVKTSLPNEYEIESIQKDHEDWTKESLLDFKALERWYTEDPKSHMEGAKKLINDMGAIEEIFTDVCTSPTLLTPNEILTKLGLENLADKSKAWIIWKHIPVLMSHLEQAKIDGAVDESGYYDIKSVLQSTHDELVSKAKLPRNLTEIKEIYSVIASSQKTIQKRLSSDGKLLSYK